jgi:hypothetical protein
MLSFNITELTVEKINSLLDEGKRFYVYDDTTVCDADWWEPQKEGCT